jgi:DNA-binding MarR family transcriptional regulator
MEKFNSSDLLQFIEQHIQSVEQLEILCLLSENSSRVWSVDEVLRHIQSTQKSVAQCLEKFFQAGLVSRSNGLYQFSRDENSLTTSALKLVAAYRARRVATIEAIYRLGSPQISSTRRNRAIEE